MPLMHDCQGPAEHPHLRHQGGSTSHRCYVSLWTHLTTFLTLFLTSFLTTFLTTLLITFLMESGWPKLAGRMCGRVDVL